MAIETIDDEWVALKPKWERFRGHPISFAAVWSRQLRRRRAAPDRPLIR